MQIIMLLAYIKGGGDYMSQMLGEIKLIPYDDIPVGWLRCSGQALYINKYPKLYMLIGTKFGKGGEFHFKLPDLTELAPKGMIYCITTQGNLPKIHSRSEEDLL